VAVLETPEGGVLLYDVGSRRDRVAERVVLPFLRARRITAVDAVFLSHSDTDHVSGMPALARNVRVRRLHPPGDPRAGDLLAAPGVSIEVLWPEPGDVAAGNDASTVLRLRAGGLTALLAGDIEEEGIRGLLHSGLPLEADVLVLPHHGRPCTLAPDLLRAVRPLVLVSSDAASDLLEPAYAGAYRTSERGAVTVGPGGRVDTFR
jgi:competence protein ComEC